MKVMKTKQNKTKHSLYSNIELQAPVKRIEYVHSFEI